MIYKGGIYIDGILYDVPLVSVKRTTEFLWKYAERNEAFEFIGELGASFTNYEMTFGGSEDMGQETYERLYEKLTELVDYHDFSIPTLNGMYSFRGYVNSVSDEIEKIYSSTCSFKALTCKFIAKSPVQRK